MLDHCRARGGRHSRRRLLPAARRRRTRPRSRILARRFSTSTASSRSKSRRSIATARSTSSNALAESGRTDVALYTGNDDAIVADLLTPFRRGRRAAALRFSGGLLGQWAVWTSKAVDLLQRCQAVRRQATRMPAPAGARRRAHRRQRRAVRSGAPVRRLHPWHSRSPAAAGTAGRTLVPRSARGAEPRADGRDRSRAVKISTPDR